MTNSPLRQLTRIALILALMTVVQSLRLFLPLPPIVSLLIIGSILNTFLLFTLYFTNLNYAILLSILMVVVAFLQQSFFSPIMALPALFANLVYLFGYIFCRKGKVWLQVILPSFFRAIALYVSSAVIFAVFGFTGAQTIYLQGIFGVLQFITGICGVLLYRIFLPKMLNLSNI